MTTPNYFPSKYSGTATDALICKADRSGAERTEYVTVSVTGGATVGQVVMLVPFRKGARFNYGGSTIYTPDLDTTTNATADIGYVYYDNTTYTNDPDAFASALSLQAAAFLTFDEFAGLSWQAAADGFIAITIVGTPTTTTGSIQAQISLFYDQ